MLDALERHPGVRLVAPLHGPAARVAARRAARRSSTVCAALVERGQVEILGGGYYEPVLASLPERDRIGQLRADGRRAGARCSGGDRAARGWRSASGSRTCPTSLVDGRLRLDDPRRRPLPRGGDPRGGPLGPVHDRGPGPAPARSSARSRACATGSRSATSRRSSTTCATHATEDGDRVGMMGDDGEKFGAWPTTWEHCWGEGRWVDRFFEALEANADWLTTTTPSAWLAANPPIGRVYIPTGSYAEMGEWALPRRREPRLRRGPRTAPGRGPARGALAARRVLAQLPGQVPRDQRPPQADAADVRRGRRDGRRAGRATWRSTTSTRASRTTATGTGCSAGIYISHMRLATYEHLIAAEDLADTAAGRAATRRSALDLDMDGLDEVRLADAGPGRDDRPGRGRRDRRLGHPGGPPRPDRGHAPPARGVSRDAARARGRQAPRGGRVDDAGRRRGRRRRRPGLDPRRRPDQGAGPRRRSSPTTRTSAAPGSSGSWRPTRRRKPGPTARPTSSAMPSRRLRGRDARARPARRVARRAVTIGGRAGARSG